jgi:predicted metal-dependent HD superfamily phosphohydrolase
MSTAVTNQILSYDEVHQFALQFFREHSDGRVIYHDLTHTQQVAAAATQIANHYHLSNNDFFIVLTAAWFHDIGYFIDMSQHEAKSAEYIANYLRDKQIDETTINAVTNCILATKLPQLPNNLLEQIVCDADLFHFGTDEFGERNKLMRKEYISVSGKEVSKEDWRKKTIQLLESHHYFTDYCQLLLNGKKQENLEQLKKKVEKKRPNRTNKLFLCLLQQPVIQLRAQPGKSKRKKIKLPRKNAPIKVLKPCSGSAPATIKN